MILGQYDELITEIKPKKIVMKFYIQYLYIIYITIFITLTITNYK